MSDIPIYSTAELLGVMQRPDDEEEGFWLRFLCPYLVFSCSASFFL